VAHGSDFQTLKPKDYFKKFFIDGPTVARPNDAEIPPETR
jgi:hypothetical protein